MGKGELLLDTRCISSLVKVFADEELHAPSVKSGTALLGEVYSFQVAYRNRGQLGKMSVSVQSAFGGSVMLREAGLVPAELTGYHDQDSDVIRTTPGLYPDPLFPLKEEGLTAFPDQWRALWVTVTIPEDSAGGEHPIKILFLSEDGSPLAAETFVLEVIGESLPEQTLIHTEWFHSDCLAVHYNVDVFSEAHWKLIGSYVKTAAGHGVNMILTPLFTPPLDTAPGAERPTVQLVGVKKTNDSYEFSFELLEKWIDLCSERGIQFFEFSHFFTQWGAGHAPKIMATEEGSYHRIFGWETDAAGEEYTHFLSQLLPELIGFIKSRNLEKQVYFHVSDEPRKEHLGSYKKASEIIHRYLADFPVIDALSDFEFYKSGIVRNPIPSSDHIEEFIQQAVPDLWTYYCCEQYKKTANRFINFPSARSRILGMQLYKFNIKGFLHWGYNFWFSRLSRSRIDPYRNTDAGYGFPAGDPFLVYPGEEGAVESIRLEVFFDALQDLRALQLLGGLIGRDEVIEMLESGLDEPITFTQYPQGPEWLLGMREKINRRIAAEKAGLAI
ncbi:DUF4091 domain-containing protein [Peribacillus sp. SCS-26]|uniref:DUF4091 domain-containing protein n=1 Tax=Paraperibacillus marinus TaxID=3115295 RepID=UPI003905BA25